MKSNRNNNYSIYKYKSRVSRTHKIKGGWFGIGKKKTRKISSTSRTRLLSTSTSTSRTRLLSTSTSLQYITLGTNIKVITWNFGNYSETKLQCITKQVITNTDNTIDTYTYIFGFQEVHTKDVKSIVDFFEKTFNKLNKQIYYAHQATFNSKFDLLTFIIYNSNQTNATSDTTKTLYKRQLKSNFITKKVKIKANIGKINNFMDFLGINTKGYLILECVSNGETYTIVNIHLPFKEEAFSIEHFYLLFKYLEDKKKVIMLGDFNTRSKFVDKCLNANNKSENANYNNNNKNTEPLINNAFNCKEDVKFIKNTPYNTEILQTKLNKCIKLTNLTDNDKDKCETLKKSLIDTDLLSQLQTPIDNNLNIGIKWFSQVKKYLEDYKEGTITFLPSYKFKLFPNTSNAEIEYELNKTKDKQTQYRLSGYADRILIKSNNGILTINENTYNILRCTGNDHLPVMVILENTNIITL